MSAFARPSAVILVAALLAVGAARGATPTTLPPIADNVTIVMPQKAIQQAAHFLLEPEYPPAARQFRLSGEVVVDMTVGLDGKVESVVVRKGSPILNDAVVRAVKRWTFAPFVVDGRVHKVKSTLSFTFQL